MTFDPSKPVQTRDGDMVTVLSTEMWGKKSIAAIVGNGQRQKLYRYFGCGRFHIGRKGNRDLINAPPNRWINVYEYLVTGPYWSRETADETAADDRIACVKATEGDGL